MSHSFIIPNTKEKTGEETVEKSGPHRSKVPRQTGSVISETGPADRCPDTEITQELPAIFLAEEQEA